MSLATSALAATPLAASDSGGSLSIVYSATAEFSVEVNHVIPYQATAPVSVVVIYKVQADFQVKVQPITYKATAALAVITQTVYSVQAPLKTFVVPYGTEVYTVSAPLQVDVEGVYAAPGIYRSEAPVSVEVWKEGAPAHPYKPTANLVVAVVPPVYQASAGIRVRVVDATAQQTSLFGPSAEVWGLKVVVGEVDVTARLVGEVTVEKNEDAAALADFSILSLYGTTDITSFIGVPVTISYRAAGTSSLVKCFTGMVDVPEYSAGTGLLHLLCTDGCQLRFERIAGDTTRAVAAAQAKLISAENQKNKIYHDIAVHPNSYSPSVILQMQNQAEANVVAAKEAIYRAEVQTATRIRQELGGLWSRHIFQPGASGWDTFNDIMSTQLASYAVDSNGVGVVTSWTAKEIPDFTFTEDAWLWEGDSASLRIDQLVTAREVVNSIDLKFEYRYTRLLEYTYGFVWNPEDKYIFYAAFAGLPAPSHATVISAISGAGLCVKIQNGANGHTGYSSQKFGKYMPYTGNYGVALYPIPEPQAVILDYNATVLNNELMYLADFPRFSTVGGARIRAVKRYSQTAAETLIVSITAPTSMKQTGRMNKTLTYGIEANTFTDSLLEQQANGWEETTTSDISYPVSFNHISIQKPSAAHGFYAEATTESAQLSVPHYVWNTPSFAPDGGVVTSVSGSSVQSWNLDKSLVDGRAERDNALATAMAVARRMILSSHRGNAVSFLIPAEPALELSHTVQVSRGSPQFLAKGKVKSLHHTFNPETGAALTRVTLALIKSWSTGVHVVDPYIPPMDQSTIMWPGGYSVGTLEDWPPHPYNLWQEGVPADLTQSPPPNRRFRGYNWFTSEFVIESPPTPQEAASSVVSVSHSYETIDLPDDTLQI